MNLIFRIKMFMIRDKKADLLIKTQRKVCMDFYPNGNQEKRYLILKHCREVKLYKLLKVIINAINIEL